MGHEWGGVEQGGREAGERVICELVKGDRVRVGFEFWYGGKRGWYRGGFD